MKKSTLACALGLPVMASLHAFAFANPQLQSALSNCQNEAVSTGLENEEDIRAYVELCMQGFATSDAYDDGLYSQTPAAVPDEDSAVSSQ